MGERLIIFLHRLECYEYLIELGCEMIRYGLPLIREGPVSNKQMFANGVVQPNILNLPMNGTSIMVGHGVENGGQRLMNGQAKENVPNGLKGRAYLVNGKAF